MNINTSRLGVFELIGYLFSGIFVVTLTVLIPIEASSILKEFIMPLYDLGAVSGVAILVLCYAVGILLHGCRYSTTME